MQLREARAESLTNENVVHIPAGDVVHPVPEKVQVGAAGPGDNDGVVLAAALNQLRCQIQEQTCVHSLSQRNAEQVQIRLLESPHYP